MSKKSSARQPFVPFFVGDFFAATAEWEGEAISIYCTLILHQWALGSIPNDPKRVCKLIRWDWELFAVHWPQVRTKFTVITRQNELGAEEERLVNIRLEEHRGKTIELSKKNAASGAKGAMSRWRKDGERHDAGMANAKKTDGKRHSDAMRKNGERHEKGWPRANGAADGNPSHPIPSHPISETSSPVHTSAGRGVPDLRVIEAGRDQWLDRIRSKYPPCVASANWIVTAKNADRICELYDTDHDALERSVERYAVYVKAGGVSNPKYVKAPQNFFAIERDGAWANEWNPPPTKAELRLGTNIDAAAEAKRQLLEEESREHR